MWHLNLSRLYILLSQRVVVNLQNPRWHLVDHRRLIVIESYHGYEKLLAKKIANTIGNFLFTLVRVPPLGRNLGARGHTG